MGLLEDELERRYTGDGIFRPGAVRINDEIRRIWAYLDTLGKPEPDNRDEALRVAVEALLRIKWTATGVSTVGAPWLRDETNTTLKKLKAMGVEIA